MSDHSRGQDLPPAIALRTNAKAPPPRHRSNPQRKNKNQPPSPAPPQGGMPSTPERVKESPKTKKLKPLVLPLLRRHAWLAGPPANTCSRNRLQSKRQQLPNHRHSGISAARRRLPPELRLRCREATAREGRRWRSSRGILSHPLQWSPAQRIKPPKKLKQKLLVLPVHRPTHAPATALSETQRCSPQNT